MKNWNKILIKAFAWFFLLLGILRTIYTIFIEYLQSPWLVGPGNIPASFTDPEMADIYLSLIIALLFIVSSAMVLLNHKNAYNVFLCTLILSFIVSNIIEFTIYDYRYVFSKKWRDIIENFLLTGIPVFLILREKNKQLRIGKT